MSPTWTAFGCGAFLGAFLAVCLLGLRSIYLERQHGGECEHRRVKYISNRGRVHCITCGKEWPPHPWAGEDMERRYWIGNQQAPN